jgi:hypothetical protein
MVSKRQVVLCLTCLLFIALAACANPSTSPGTQVTPIPEVVAPYRGPVLVQFCSDDTGRYPRVDFLNANKLVASSLAQAVVPNSAGLVLYATAITSNTFDTANTLAPFVVPPIDNYPALPTPIPSPAQQNPVTYPATATAAAARNSVGIATYNTQVTAVRDQLRVVKGQVSHDANRLITWNPPVDSKATSIWGCLQLARARFQGQPGTKDLIMASAMENTTNVDFTQDFTTSQALKGINVHVIFYACTGSFGNAQQCQDKTAYWQGVISSSGAQSVRFDDPAQSLALTNLFGGA